MIKNGRLAGFVAIILFRWTYSTPRQKIWKVTCLVAFLVSSLELVRSLLSFSADRWFENLYLLLVTVVSAISLVKDIWALLVEGLSDRHMVRFFDRRDGESKGKLNTALQQLACLEPEKGFSNLEMKSLGYFAVYSSKINAMLCQGAEILVGISDFSSTAVWKKINRNMKEVCEILTLKQKADGFVQFFNEQKVMQCSPLKPSTDGRSLEMRVARSCYYASYLTNESYRDQIIDSEGMTQNFGSEGRWFPFDNYNGDLRLRCLDGRNSAHVGVNTIGITADGYVLIWQQGSGQHSRNFAAPTGSGSMDWADIGNSRASYDLAGRIAFNQVIISAVERELTEESFAGVHLKGGALETRIIGYFRWGARGGLPGFVCLTRIPLKMADIRIDNREVCRNHDLETLRMIGSKQDMITAINTYMREREKNIPMSLPLHVALVFLRDAIISGEIV